MPFSTPRSRFRFLLGVFLVVSYVVIVLFRRRGLSEDGSLIHKAHVLWRAETAPDALLEQNPPSLRKPSARRPTRVFVQPSQQLQLDPRPDYGTIFYTPSTDFRRSIKANDDSLYEDEKQAQYDAFKTDDSEKDWSYIDRSDREYRKACKTPTWAMTLHPVCNTFHESANVAEPHVKWLGRGYFRSVFLFRGSNTPFVLKSQRMERDYGRYRYNLIHTEASIMEKLTASPSVTNTYGLCGTANMVEPADTSSIKDLFYRRNSQYDERKGRINAKELQQYRKRTGKYSLNNHTASEKLEIAIGIAESIAEVHGLPTGPVIVADVHLQQFVMHRRDPSEKPRIMLNDFDNSRVMKWNIETQDYCREEHVAGPAAPEKVNELPLDESLDMWHVGEVLYTVQTGLLPFYEELENVIATEKYETKKKELIMSSRPYFDPVYKEQGIIESRLMEIVERCLEMDPNKRANIFDVLEHLRATKQLAQRRNSHRGEDSTTETRSSKVKHRVI